MNSKAIIFLGMGIGSTVGSLLASMLGFDAFSLTSGLFAFAGGAAGIYTTYKMIN